MEHQSQSMYFQNNLDHQEKIIRLSKIEPNLLTGRHVNNNNNSNDNNNKT